MMTNTSRLFKCILLILSVLLVSKANAQEISVSSFQLLENDLTANTYGTLQKDHNGEVAALIKIPTTVQGFTFDGGMVGIVKTEQHVGEIWVYVPHGIKRISIFHQQLGHLRDYYFPIPIEKARTYEMKVVTAQVQTITNVTVQQQFVVFQVEPKDASVEINDEILIVNEQGMATKRLPYGRYNYRVSSPNYHTQAGVLEVTAENKAMIQVSLKPNFGWIELNAAEEYHGAYVYLDGERIGQVPLITEALKSGKHSLRIMKPSYKVLETEALVSDNDTTQIDVSLDSNMAAITLLAADEECEIWVDNELKGKGSCVVRLEVGEYKAEVRKPSHQSASVLVKVTGNEAQSITLPQPVALYGSLEVMSMPFGASVYLDDAPVGETPLLLNNIFIGTHQVRLESAGYASLEKTIEVEHSKTASLNVSMEKETSKAKIEKPKKEEPKPEPKPEPKKEEPKNPKPKKPELKMEKPASESKLPTFMAYAGAGVQVMPKIMISTQAGAYFKGVNVEYNYGFEPGFETQKYDLRAGYGLKLGKSFMLTPQVGYGALAGFDDYGVYRNLHKGILAACRVQMNFGNNFSAAVSPSYHLAIGEVALNASIMFNLPLAK